MNKRFPFEGTHDKWYHHTSPGDSCFVILFDDDMGAYRVQVKRLTDTTDFKPMVDKKGYWESVEKVLVLQEDDSYKEGSVSRRIFIAPDGSLKLCSLIWDILDDTRGKK